MMKKNILLIAFLFIFFGSNAQNYIPFPEANAKWVTNIYFKEPQNKPGSYCYDSHIETIGDTLMGGLKYIKLKETKVEYVAYSWGCLWQDTITSTFYGWMRNDSADKKVYFRKWNWSKDTLLYDFDLQVNDTVPSTYFFNNRSSVPFIIDTIKQLNIGGINRYIYIQ